MRAGRDTDIGWRVASPVAGVVAAAILLGIMSTVTHSAYASDLGLPGQPTAVASTASVTPSELAKQRTAALRQIAAQVEAAVVQTRLRAHQNSEQKSTDAIKTEVTRLKNLSSFAWPTEGGVSSGFGMRKHPILGYVRLHNGADIGGACGNPIIAAQSGTVSRAGYSRSSGNNVRIDHDLIEGVRVETAYLHMSRLVVRAGQKVAKGELIGYVGSTGLSTACHLHLALYKDAKGSDPLEYLQRS